MIKSTRVIFSLFLVTALVIGNSFTAYAVDPTLKFYWPFDEGTGTDVGTTSGYPGTLTGGPTWIPEGGLTFDGINDYARTNSPLSDSMGVSDQGYTLSASVRLPDAEENGNIIHISSGAGGSGWCIAMLHVEDGHFRAIGWNDGPVTALDPTVATPGEWYSIANTWSPETQEMELYVNGALVSSAPMSNFTAADQDVYVFAGVNAPGCDNNHGWFKGDVKDVRIYSRAITSEEANQNSNESLGTISATLSPTDNASDVAVDSNLEMTFSTAEVIPATGTVSIYKADDDSLVETIDVTSLQVTKADDVMTINPTADFEEGTEYYVLISEGAFEDNVGNTYPGISSSTAWNFTTAAPTEDPEPDPTPTRRRTSVSGMASPAYLASMGITLANDAPSTTNPSTAPSLGEEGICSANQLLTQNLRTGAQNGSYHPYTQAIVTEVKILQDHLNRLGFNAGTVDGILGPITDSAIKRMQIFLKTDADGMVGPITRGLLNNSCGATTL